MSHDVGCLRSFEIDMFTRGYATFGGPNQEYRYTLERDWGGVFGTVMFVMMNPSAADVTKDDATVAKCRNYVDDWGFDRLLVGNTFAYRATDQKRLLEVDDPVGPENDRYLLEMARRSDRIVFAYGIPHTSLRYRGPQVVRMFEQDGHAAKIHALKLCADGTPSHPLYLRGDLQGFRWKRREMSDGRDNDRTV